MEQQSLFLPVDLAAGWSARPGRVGVSELRLAGALDPAARTGRSTRLVRFEPGASAPATKHDWSEEIYLVSGDISVVDVAGRVVSRAEAPGYVRRPPQELHGPYASENGCLLLQIEYFDG